MDEKQIEINKMLVDATHTTVSTMESIMEIIKNIVLILKLVLITFIVLIMLYQVENIIWVLRYIWSRLSGNLQEGIILLILGAILTEIFHYTIPGLASKFHKVVK